MDFCSAHEMRSDTGRVEVVSERLAGSGPFTLADMCTYFLALLRALFSLCIHLVVMAVRVVESSAQIAHAGSAVPDLDADTKQDPAESAGPQEAKSDVDPITWHHNDLASEVNGGQNPLPLDLDPEVSYALGSAGFSELENLNALPMASPALRSMWKCRQTVIIIPQRTESSEVQRVPSAKLSAQPPPLGALTPSQVNARASSPALTSTSPLKGSPPKVGEKPRADLKDAERHLLDERPLIDPSLQPCLGKRPDVLRRGTVAFTATNSRPVCGRAPTEWRNEGGSLSHADRVHARQAAAALRHVAIIRNRKAQAAR